MCIQAVALVSQGRVSDIVVDDDKGELGLCMKLASAANSILERQIIVTAKQEEHRKMLKITETLSHMVGELQMLTSQSARVCNGQGQQQHMNGRSYRSLLRVKTDFLLFFCPGKFSYYLPCSKDLKSLNTGVEIRGVGGFSPIAHCRN